MPLAKGNTSRPQKTSHTPTATASCRAHAVSPEKPAAARTAPKIPPTRANYPRTKTMEPPAASRDPGPEP